MDNFFSKHHSRQIPPRGGPGKFDTNATDVAVEFSTTNDERTRYFGTVDFTGALKRNLCGHEIIIVCSV